MLFTLRAINAVALAVAQEEGADSSEKPDYTKQATAADIHIHCNQAA